MSGIDWQDHDAPSPLVTEMPPKERLVEDLLAGAWDSHDQRGSRRSERTLNRAGAIREAYYDGRG